MQEIVSSHDVGMPLAMRRWPLGVALALLLVGFLSTLVSFSNAWSESRAHGYVIAAFCVWLLYTARTEFRESAEWRVPCAVVSALLSVVWLFATVVGIRVGYQLAALGIAVCWSGALFGRSGLERTLPIAGIFLLAVPVWELLLGVLQAMTVAVNGAAISVFGLGATLSGTRIHFPFGTIEVAESCAGLSYFMSAFTISVIYARLFLRTTQGRVLAVALALGLAIVSNWVRVFGLVVIGYATRMTSPLMDEHATYGWVIFAVVLSAFFLLTGTIERWERHPQRTGGGDWLARTLDRVLGDAEPEWLAGEPRVPAHRGSVWGATAAALIGPMVYALFSWLPAVETISPTTPGVQPGTQWSVQASRPVVAASDSAGRADSTNLEWTPAFTGESQRVHQRWSNGATAIQVDRYVYRRQSQGSELISSGNRMADAERTLSERVVGPLDANLRVVREVVTRTPNGVRLIWYWYRVAEVQTSSPVQAKLLEFVAFLGRRGPSELTAVSAPCGTNDCALALDAVYEFVTGQRPRA